MRLLLSGIMSLGLALLGGGFLLNACGTLAGNPEEETTSGTKKTEAASVTFSLADAPVEDVKHVYVTVARLEVSQEGDDTWTSIPLQKTTEIDLLELQDGKSTVLATISSLPAGTYKQTRLILTDTASPRLVEEDGTVHYLQIPSGTSSGIKIMTPFTVSAGDSVALTLDFDLRKSLKKTGPGEKGGGKAHGRKLSEKYLMKPVLRLVEDNKSGSINGHWAGASTVCVYPENVTEDDNDECENSGNSGRVASSGAFTVGHLPAGKYKVRAFFKDGSLKDQSEVVVTARGTAELGTLP